MSRKKSKSKWAKKYPGYMSTTDAERISGWRQDYIQQVAKAHVFKNTHRVCEIDPTRPNGKRWLVSDEDTENMRWLNFDMHRKPCIEDIEIIDDLRAKYDAALPTTVSTKPRSTAAPKAAQPKEATAAVVEVRSRSNRINERLWNIAAGFIIAGGIALGFIAFMVVIIGVAALM